jgi:stearoyl-CoA desaturase (delta-9 desaturase)
MPELKHSDSTAPHRVRAAPIAALLRWFDSSVQPAHSGDPDAVDWLRVLPFIGLHIACLGVIWVGVSWFAVAVAAALYALRMFAITGFYHRYFSHRAFKTSRPVQFLFAALGAMSVQRGPLWWAAHHRDHHKYSDLPWDVHSPIQRGLLYAHVGWMFDNTEATDYSKIKDLAKYPELVWLNKYWWVPPVALGFAVWLTLGWSGLLIGFSLSTVLLWHGTFTINSLAHVWGSRTYETTDTSRNNLFLALITCGEGWHNNHHRFPGSAAQGMRWWQVDPRGCCRYIRCCHSQLLL